MDVRSLYEHVHDEADPRAWSAGVKLARQGMVTGRTADAEEVHLQVQQAGRPPLDTWLFPADEDWDCSCDLPKPCVHVCAGIIALHQGHLGGARKPAAQGAQTREKAAPLPAPKKVYQARVRYEFVSKKNALTVQRSLVHHNGKASRLNEALSRTNAQVSRADQQAETLLTMHRGGPMSAEMLRRLIALLDEDTLATLDGKPIHIRREAISFRVRVTHDGEEAFKVNLVRDPRMTELFRGATVIDDGLHPTSHGRLNPDQRKLLVKGVRFSAGEVRKLVSEYLPALTDRIPVDIATDRLPEAHALVPRVRMSLATSERGLEVKAEIVYGDPPVARVVNDVLEPLGEVIPARDVGKERAVKRTFEDRIGLAVGFRHVLPPDKAALFIKEKLPRHDGPVHGRDVAKNFKIVDDVVLPEIEVLPYGASALPPMSRSAMTGLSDWTRDEPGGYRLDVNFESASGMHRADPKAVLAAWRQGRSLVPLLDGGYAPLPTGWLDEHGALLREILESRDDATGKVQRAATAALVEMVEQMDIPAPPSLKKLHSFLEGDGALPDAALPDGFNAELRPYQQVGYQWLRFLRGVDLNGVLADDMGLGKTVQALAALADAGGRSLVVAPTSVLGNWEREAKRFAPRLSVNIYHGPKRQLDDSDLTLTSYALVRQDIDQLNEIEFTYAVLDEAQAIKNPDSQTAKAVRKLDARHRLCLTGTPVENRLEELWSLFHFLMPGFLSSKEAFRDRFVKPIEVGDAGAADALRRRVRPYVMRRLKKQVAAELPELTDVVVRCPMTDDQRKVYDAVRLAMREDVQRAIQEKGEGGATLQVLEALLRMRQACCDPSLLPESLTTAGASSAKLDRLEELLVEVVSEGHKVLVFSQWTSLLDRVEPRLAALGIEWLRLDGSTRNRQEVVDSFQSDDGPPVFLLTLKAGGTGLNLTAADYVVHLDPWWNPAVQQQATDRAHRIGQTNPVVSYRLVAEDSVEERILDLQDAKRDLAEAALGTDGGFVKNLSARELRALFEE